MRFPPSFIERLRSHFLISEVIGRRIPIKKHGREFQGLCPFHSEKSPSFTVNDEKGFYHCFGCGAHGDAIEFIKLYERLTYPETIERLARDAGIPLPERTPEDMRKAEAEKTLLGVMDAACQWFEAQLGGSSGATARTYIERRGLTEQTVRAYRIGYAPDERTGLHQYLIKAGFSQALQAEAGLIIVPDQGAAYDRFRGRLMFPIRSASGKIIAFGGRLLASNDANKHLPKYLNSPETPLFKKGEMLFNLDLARRPAREKNIAVVMEGYMDVVSSAQAGVAYAVATLGTAVTPEHLRLLWQIAKEPVMCLDGDEAGSRAMLRATEIALPLLKPGYSLRFAVLPQGEDPDSYIQKHGKASFEQILQSAKPLSQVLWETLAAQFKLKTPEDRAALDDACKQIAAKITDATVRSHFASYFRSQLWEKRGKGQQPAAQARSAHVGHMVAQHHSATLDKLVLRMLATLLECPALLHKSQIEEALSTLDIHDTGLSMMRDALLDAGHHIEPGGDLIGHARAQLPEECEKILKDVRADLAYHTPSTSEEALRQWQRTAASYEISHLEYELQSLQESLGQNMDEAAYQRLVELKQALHKAQAARTFAPPESDVA
jgi:DNA primase